MGSDVSLAAVEYLLNVVNKLQADLKKDGSESPLYGQVKAVPRRVKEDVITIQPIIRYNLFYRTLCYH